MIGLSEFVIRLSEFVTGLPGLELVIELMIGLSPIIKRACQIAK